MSFEKIASRQNPRVLRLVKLRERAARVAEGVFLLEGLRELERAVLSGIEIREFYFCPELIRNPLAEKVFALAKKTLPAAEKAKLTAEQSAWLETRTQTMEAAGKDVEGGSVYALVVNMEAARLTEARTNELYELLK